MYFAKGTFQNKWRLNSRVYCVCHMHSLLVTVVLPFFSSFLALSLYVPPFFHCLHFSCCSITVNKRNSGPRRFKYAVLKRSRKTRWMFNGEHELTVAEKKHINSKKQRNTYTKHAQTSFTDFCCYSANGALMHKCNGSTTLKDFTFLLSQFR